MNPTALADDCIHTPASPEAKLGPLFPRPWTDPPAGSETLSPLLPAGWPGALKHEAAPWEMRSGPTLRHQIALLADGEEKK